MDIKLQHSGIVQKLVIKKDSVNNQPNTIMYFIYLTIIVLVVMLTPQSYIFAKKEPRVTPELLPAEMSPFNQYLPDCKSDYPRLTKKTNAKALLCPMIK
jgi:hypothetical protein